jgi:CBS domain-containing protein
MPKVSDLMTRTVIHTILPNANVRDAACRMKEVHSGCLVVTNRGMLIGIITERDLVQRVIAEGRSFRKTLVSQIMSSPVIAVSPRAPVSFAASLMLKNGIRRLPVRDHSKLVGMLTTTDFAKSLSKKYVKEPMLAATARAEYQTIFE